MYKEFLIKEVTQAEAHTIIQSREPRGLFYQWNGKHWVGIDNMTGDAWCEEFIDLDQCLAWLRRE